MNTGVLLLIPFVLVRFVLLALLDKSSLKRAAHFASMYGKERVAYWLYQLSNLALFVYLFFLNIRFGQTMIAYLAGFTYFLGVLFLLLSSISFAFPSKTGVNKKGVYRFSRHPMYVAYFIYFIGCTLLTRSLLLLSFVLLFQSSGHWIVLAEERECIENFGEEYLQYMSSVRRYI